jgi:peptide-methionine (R)-S-oxide reductase
MSEMHDRLTSDGRPTPPAPAPTAPLGRRAFLGRAGAKLLSARLALPLLGSGAALALSACRSTAGGSNGYEQPQLLPREEWRRLLTPEQFHILFEEGTERAGSSPLDKVYDPGTYVCAACFQPLFSSETKYDSRSGWPSFWTHLPGAIGTKEDNSFFMRRTECHCSRCGGHQGHVFSDGPPPTGERWCINGLALAFVPEGQPLPELRG